MSSLERLGEAGWLPDVRSEESIAGQACNQPNSSSEFSKRACLPWPDLPVTHTGFWDPPPVPLTVLSGDG